MRRTNLAAETCPIARSLNEIGDWWTLLIVREAFHGLRRFSEFQKCLGLAKNILVTRLRKMVSDGILERRPTSDGSGHSEYHLTEKGLRLRVVLIALRQWGEDNLFEEGEPMKVMVRKNTGDPIGRLRITARNGRPIGPLDVEVKDGYR
jgi:DNA-binding HxlR family transcriptional regulator